MQQQANQLQTKSFYEFDEFRVDPVNRLLFRNDELIPLTAKVFDILLVFVENSGKLLEKETLLQQVWQDSFVEEGNLTRNVSTLRKALGEDPKAHHYIVTIPGRGYQFVASVRKVAQPTAQVIEEQVITTTIIEEASSLPEPATIGALPAIPGDAKPAKPFANRKVLLGVGAVCVGVILLIAVFLLRQQNQAAITNNAKIKSLAVLPLKPLDSGDNYMGLGIADAVIRRINQTGELTVRPTSAVRRYLNEDTDALTAARQLNVDAVLEGNVQRADDRLRVSVNLLRTGDGVSLWSENFDLQKTDIFTIQDRVAQQVATRLRLQLDPEQKARLTKRSTSNPIAYEFYVKGIYSFDQREGYTTPIAKPQMEATIDFFKKAIENDPNYALAHAQLAYAYAWKVLFIEPTEPVWAERAKEEITRAQTLDSQLAEPHIARHLLLWSAYEGFQNEAAVRELLLAQQLNPNIGHAELASLYQHIGLEDSAARELQRALDIDPTSEFAKGQTLNLYDMGSKYDEWLAAFQRLYPGKPTPAWYFMGKGQLDEAQKVIEKWAAKNPDDIFLPPKKALLLALKGDFRSAEAEIPSILSKHPLKDPNYHHATYDIACIYALAGKSEEAVKWLRETAATGFPCYSLFERDPYLNRIRQTPEFIQFMAEMKAQHERYVSEFK